MRRKIYVCSLLAMGLAMTTGCKTVAPTAASEGKALLGDKVRHEVRDEALTGAIGRLSYDDTNLCSGAFIGKNEVLVARHCVDPSERIDLARLVFTTSMGRYTFSEVALNAPKADQLILKTTKESPFVLSRGELRPEKKVTIYGYNLISEKLYGDEGSVQRMSEAPGLLAYRIDTEAGTSGGPIIQEDKIVGYHVGFYSIPTQRDPKTYIPRIEANLGVELMSAPRVNFKEFKTGSFVGEVILAPVMQKMFAVKLRKVFLESDEYKRMGDTAEAWKQFLANRGEASNLPDPYNSYEQSKGASELTCYSHDGVWKAVFKADGRESIYQNGNWFGEASYTFEGGNKININSDSGIFSTMTQNGEGSKDWTWNLTGPLSWIKATFSCT